MKENILIIEDDAFLAEGIRLNLEIAGYQAEKAYSLQEAREFFEKEIEKPELLLLDVNLPDGEGFAFAEEIRSISKVPILFLTARDLDEDMLRGFRVGADDYITKPFNVQVLIERIRAVLNRYRLVAGAGNGIGRSNGIGNGNGTGRIGDAGNGNGVGSSDNTGNGNSTVDNGIFKIGNLVIDFESYQVTKSGKSLALTPTEFRLLEKFCRNPQIVLTREILLEELWDKDGNFVDEHTLTIFVSRLKRKIADEQYSYIKNVYGTGYRWIGAES